MLHADLLEGVTPDLSGRTLGGRHRLLRMLGAGGMGSVWEAENTRTGRRVAVKVLDASRSADSAQVARFLQEARSAARIAHPNVVDVIDLDRDDDVLYIVQELLVGEDLQSRLAARGRLSVDETLALAIPALRGVAHAHAVGVVHRDLKPSNIFLAREGDGVTVPKIIDFGISKIVDDGAALVLTTTGEVFGTPAYMSPEQLRGARGVDARADVWAFGVLLYECVAGCLPVDGENYNVLVHEVLSGRRRPLHEAAPDVPPAFADVVMRAIAMDPAERFADAGALLDALTPFASTLRPAAISHDIAPQPPAAARLDATAPAASTTLPDPPRARRWPLAVGALALLIPIAWTLRPAPNTQPIPAPPTQRQVAANPPAPAAPPTLEPAAITPPPPTPTTAATVAAPAPARASPPRATGAHRRSRSRHHERADLPAAQGISSSQQAPPSRAALLAPGGAYPFP